MPEIILMGNTLDEREFFWAAGLLEGEGSFSVTWPENYTRPPIRVSCGMTDEDVLSRLRNALGVGKVYGPYESGSKSERAAGAVYKKHWIWVVNNREEVRSLCLVIKPLMGSRRRTAIEKVLDHYGKSRELRDRGQVVNE